MRRGLAYRRCQRRRVLRGARLPGLRQAVGQDASTTCAPARASRSTRPSATRSTSCCGRRPSPASRRGTRRGATGGPGWHIECSAMSCAAARRALRHPRRRRGPAVPAPRERDRAVRGRDRRARSSNYWMHNGFVNVDDEKMSKSLGNFFTHARRARRSSMPEVGALLHPARALPQPAQLLRRAPRRREARARRGSTRR